MGKLANKEPDPTEPKIRSSLSTDRTSLCTLNPSVGKSFQNTKSSQSNLSLSCINNNLIDNSVQSVEISCDEDYEETRSICAEPIPGYIPKYIQGLLINPAFQNCDDYEDDPNDDETYETPG